MLATSDTSNSNERTLFIAPFPPPKNGQSLAASVLFNLFEENGFELIKINTSKKRREVKLIHFITRLFGVLQILIQVFKNRGAKSFYLTLSESIQGNIKDLITLLILYPRLDHGVLHMLGGANIEKILKAKTIRAKLSSHLFGKTGAIIVEGEVQKRTFKSTGNRNIRVVKNFVEPHLYSNRSSVLKKYKDSAKLRILFLSNMLMGKGYLELLRGYLMLDVKIRDQYELTFVGGFKAREDQEQFNDLAMQDRNISYLGNFIDGEEKRKLYLKSHIFALPSYYPFEGQPISILEAYASGCYVISSQHSGIKDIFNASNGTIVIEQSNESIRDCLNSLWKDQKHLARIGFNNYLVAQKHYSISRYISDIEEIIF